MPGPQCRYAVGSILSEGQNQVDQECLKLYEASGFNVFSFPEVTHVVTTSFPHRKFFSALMRISRVYPRLQHYIKVGLLWIYCRTCFYYIISNTDKTNETQNYTATDWCFLCLPTKTKWARGEFSNHRALLWSSIIFTTTSILSPSHAHVCPKGLSFPTQCLSQHTEHHQNILCELPLGRFALRSRAFAKEKRTFTFLRHYFQVLLPLGTGARWCKYLPWAAASMPVLEMEKWERRCVSVCVCLCSCVRRMNHRWVWGGTT